LRHLPVSVVVVKPGFWISKIIPATELSGL